MPTTTEVTRLRALYAHHAHAARAAWAQHQTGAINRNQYHRHYTAAANAAKALHAAETRANLTQICHLIDATTAAERN